MRTTVRLDDNLLARAKEEAARRGVTFTTLIEQGLRHELALGSRRPKRPRAILPVCRQGGGVLPGIDLNATADLMEIMDGRR